jgi:hypothetical protein
VFPYAESEGRDCLGQVLHCHHRGWALESLQQKYTGLNAETFLNLPKKIKDLPNMQLNLSYSFLSPAIRTLYIVPVIVFKFILSLHGVPTYLKPAAEEQGWTTECSVDITK